MNQRLEVGNLNPVGYVISDWKATDRVQIGDQQAVIHLFDEYLPALKNITAHSHFWILSWFHESDRSVLKTRPVRINASAAEYGVFGLRTPARPNPIALTLVELIKLKDNKLYVLGLDAIDGTPVLDIKPYFEMDIIFSPRTPYICPSNHEHRRANFYKQALLHHGEACAGLELGAQMALLAAEHFGQIQAPDVKVFVKGDACLADVLQGLSRARLASPARFEYKAAAINEVCWQKGEHSITMRQHPETGKAEIINKG